MRVPLSVGGESGPSVLVVVCPATKRALGRLWQAVEERRLPHIATTAERGERIVVRR